MTAANGTAGVDTRAALMEATYRALCEHGYADLTMQAIADESDKSKAALHYHFDTKEELLTETLAYLLDQFLEDVRVGVEDGPEQRLRTLVEAMLFGNDGRDGDSDDHWRFHTALLEVQSHAAHRDAYREQFTENYTEVRETVADIVADGVESGDFREVDPDTTAAHLVAAIKGARVHQVSTDREDVATTVHDAIERRIIDPLVAE